MKKIKRIRIDTTVDSATNWWLKQKSEQTNIPVGRLLDNLILNEMLKERNEQQGNDWNGRHTPC